MKKIFKLFIFLFLLSSFVFANPITNYIKNSNFDEEAKVALYLLDYKNGKTLYKRNENLLLNPASGLKLLTLGVSYMVLGSDYNFETGLYQDDDNNFYIKLGGDILLKKEELIKLLSNLKGKNINNIYIDDTIFDKVPYPSSWLDEDKWPDYGMVSPYYIDFNTTEISLKKSYLTNQIEITQNDIYKIPIINELKLGSTNKIKIEKLYGDDSSIVNLKGTISDDRKFNLYVVKPEINFNVKLNYALEKNGFICNRKIDVKKVPDDAKKIATIDRPIDEIAKLVLHQSNNIASEIVFKVAASKYYQKEATFDDSIKMFMDFYGKKMKKDEQIVDASGVSRQNHLSLKTISLIMFDVFKKTDLNELLVSANQGTMKDRLLFLENNLRVKTGTMKNYSSLYGTFKTKKNTHVLFLSIIQDSKKRKSILKNYENSLIGIIYKNY